MVETLFGLGSATADRLRRRLPPQPGMTWCDSYIARTVAHTGPNPWGRTLGTYSLLGLVSGLMIGLFGSAIATVEIDDHLTSGVLEAFLITNAWIALTAVLPAALSWLGGRWDRYDRHRYARRRDEQADRDLRDDAARCHCLQIRRLSGRKASLYLDRHLVPAPFDGPAANPVHDLHPRARVARCPSTGVAWLHLQLEEHRAPHLLRGTPPAGAAPNPDSSRHGMYL
jgi:hypothetical protein